MTSLDKTSRLVGFEERAASLYLGLANRFAEDKELSWFWLGMSMEEKQHAVLLEFCINQKILAGKLPDMESIQALSILFNELEERARRPELSVDEAFLIAAELEGSEVNGIYAGLVGPSEGTWYILRKKIETLAPDHMQILIEAARKSGVSASTLAKLCEIEGGKTPKAG